MAQTKGIAPRSTNGGISAPKSAAKGPNISQNKAYPPYWGENKPWGEAAQKTTGMDEIYTKPPASSAATPSAATPRPWDAAYLSSENTANTKYNNSILGLDAKKLGVEQDYGLDAGFNDYKANPYSRAALLEQTYQRANRAAGNSLAAAGQLYSGASQNAETYNREHNGQERNALESLYRQSLQQNSDERTAALNEREAEKNAALWKSIELASNADLNTESDNKSNGGGSSPSGGNPLPQYLQSAPNKAKINGKKVAVGNAKKAK